MLKAKKLISALMACTIASTVVHSAGAGYVPVALAAAAVDTPVASSPAGRYEQSVSVALSSNTAGADIYYTLDGTMPDETSLKYTGTPIVLTESTNVSVIALKDGVWSKAATYGYIIKSTEKPLLKFAAMSDIHIGPGTSDQDAKTRGRWASNFDVISSIFPNPDAILIAGDVINDNGNGLGPHHQFARDVLQEQLTRKNWTNLTVQIAIGNHDASVAEVKQYYPTDWFTDQTNGYYEKTIGGYSFFFLNANNYNGDTGQRNWLKGRLAALTADPANLNKPIFITLHHPVTGTVMDGQQAANPNLYTDLKDYPQVVVFSGHSHLNINDDRSIYQKDFTTVNVGSMSYVEVDHGYSAVTEEGLIDGRFEFPVQQSQFVEVYKDRIEIERIEYNGDAGSVYVGGVWQGAGQQTSFRSAGALAGNKWVVKLEGGTKEEIKSNFTYTQTNRNKTAPQFPANPDLKVLPGTNNVPVLSFNQAKDDQSLHHYEIKVYNQRTAQVVKSYNVLSDYYFSPIPNEMNIPMTGLSPATSYVITVAAVDAYGNKSAPLQSFYRTDGTPPELTPIDPNTMWNQLVSDMKFDGNLNEDAAGVTGLATMAGNVTYIAGKSGQAASIAAGNANYIDLGGRPDLNFGNGDFTVSFWHTGNLAGDQTVLSNKNWNSGKNPGWYIGPATANNMTLNMADGTNRIDYSAQGVGTEWHYFTISVDRTNKMATTYVDGVMKANKDLTALGASSMDTPYHIILGADGNKGNGGATVTLDDLKIWKRALTATEAKALSDSYQSTTLYTFSQLTTLIQESEQFAAYIAATTGLSLPDQAKNELTARTASAKALTAGDSAAVIDQAYLDLMWAVQTAKNAVMYTFIPKTSFSINSFSTVDLENNVASNILDGQESTIWHSKWETPAAPFPHWVIIDMESTYKLNGIQRKSRLNQSAMEFPKNFELYASDNLADFNDSAFLNNAANKATGTFGKTWTGTVYKDYVSLDKTVQGRYVKFIVTGTYNTDLSKTFTSMSEIDFTGDKVASGNASLSDLQVNSVSLEGFKPDKLDYSLNVPNTATNANVTYTASEPQAVVVVTGNSNLQVGDNIVHVTVTAPNGNVKTYVINVNRADMPPSLSDLRVNGVTLSGFAWDKLDYSLSVPYETTVAAVTYTATHTTATVAVTGGDNLIVGANPVTVTLTAPDQPMKVYTILITRNPKASSSDSSLLDLRVNGTTLEGFASNRLQYSLSVPYETTVTRVTYTTSDPAASVQIHGGENLVVGDNPVTVTVTAQNGTKSVYGILITRQSQAQSSNASLSDLRVNGTTLSGFAPDKLSYSLDVSYSTTVAEVTYSTEHASAKVTITGDRNLSVGSNRFTVLVTAEDGATKEYVIAVNRYNHSSRPSGGSGSSATPPVKPELPDNAAAIKDESLKSDLTTVSVELTEGKNQVAIPMAQADQLNGRPLIVQAPNVKLSVPAELLKSVSSLLPSADDSAVITVKIDPIAAAQTDRSLKEASRKDNAAYTLGGQVFELSIFVTDKDGKQYTMNELTKPVTITFPIPAGMDPKLAGIYEIQKDGSLVYLGGTNVNGNTAIEVGVNRLGQYAVLSLDKYYNDVTNQHWAFSTIRELSAKHIVNGETNSSFAPNKDVTRAEFAALLVRTLGLTSDVSAPFGDVAGNAWYAKEVSAAYKAGIVTGDSQQTFDPNRSITREEMAIMLVRAYELRTGKKLDQATSASSDASEISDWARSYVNSAMKAKLLSGRQEGLFVPAEHTTRAEAAQAVYNLLK
ncbi:hypothetical protein DVH26_06665 [Paenibacillus sp. H1-7]|uniref:cadherin-like beta sandwich domain-containing protein n=1 Tax=Paenibacillus sp. H1-7 TaxID=2282849 RepID=UPI001EF8ED5A|nr:cadherin-like beta sandwich domain-containing protein [Paenibacillus sp. H1-7]ULL14152.1 hypothetical protein DVH26_06665 [Paenibacillus sp. H1-7]